MKELPENQSEVIVMKIIPVTDPSFAPYGRIVEGYDVKGIE